MTTMPVADGAYDRPDLRDLLAVERAGADVCVGHPVAGKGGRAFGGALVAQALNTAGCTVEEGRPPQSLHAYFVSAARADRPVEYEVRPVRDGGQVSVRHVTGRQEGTVRVEMTCSFLVAAPSTEHHHARPDAPAPEGLPKVGHVVPGAAEYPCSPLDLRPCPPASTAVPPGTPLPPRQTFWLRFLDEIGDDPLLQACALAYVSDVGLSHAGDRPHLGEPGRRLGASLDHAVWFHRRSRLSGWLFVDQHGSSYADRRAFARGELYAPEGQLLASCVQEAMIVRR